MADYIFIGIGILSSTGAIHGYLMAAMWKGCYALRCELCTIATIFLGHQQALAVRWLVAFPICSLLLSKKGLWPSLWPVWHLFFASIQKNEVWDRKNEITKKKRSPSGSIFLVPRYYTRLAPSASCRAWFCLPVCCCGWAVVLAALGWLWGVVVGEPLVWKGGKGRQQMHNSVLSLARAPSLGWGFGRTWL